MQLYVDGMLEGDVSVPGMIFGAAKPLNIGGFEADGSVASSESYFGLVDEAFITADLLSANQIRNLYCVKIPHTLSAVPKSVGLNIRRRKKGAALAPADFPTQPLRLHNFSAGSLSDEGSNGQVLVNNNGAISVPGVDGSLGNAFNFVSSSNQYLSATDAGLPVGLATRSIGCWFKVSPTFNGCFVAYGSGLATSDVRIDMFGTLRALNGGLVIVTPFPPDSEWHLVVLVQDNAAVDGLKSKLYLDGRLVGVDTTNLVSITSGGANKFRIGADIGGTSQLTGQIDAAFVCDYALDTMQIAALYAKGAQVLGLSPMPSVDHVEMMNGTDLFCVFDSIDTQDLIDLVVA